jgi:hypothetical protein
MTDTCNCNSKSNEYTNKIIPKSENKMVYYSTLLNILKGLFINQNSDIVVEISTDGHILSASNISEIDIVNMYLPVNNPDDNAHLNFIECKVTLDSNFVPLNVPGLNTIIPLKIGYENTLAYAAGVKIYQPFVNGFQAGSFNKLVDELSSLTALSTSVWPASCTKPITWLSMGARFSNVLPVAMNSPLIKL